MSSTSPAEKTPDAGQEAGTANTSPSHRTRGSATTPVASVVSDVRARKPPSRAAFDVAQYVLALGVAAIPLHVLTDLGDPAEFRLDDVLGVALAIAAFFAVNTGSVSIVIALHQRSSLRRQLSADITFHSVTELILLGLAPVTVLTLERSPVLAPLLVLPLLAVHRAGANAMLSTHIAGHDALTGLPNRTLFADRTGHALALARRDGDFTAVMLLDLDRFKQINDTLGHAAGDVVLCEVAQRIAATIGDTDTVARLGGDEFAVLVRSAPGPHEAATLGERIRAAVLPPVEVDGVPLSLDVSIGVAWFGTHGEDAEVLVQRADVAMYEAKAAGGGVRCYAAERDAHSVTRLAMAEGLRAAIRDGDLHVHFQPQVDLATGCVTAVEALARWVHLEVGPVTPSEFIPVAEESGVITALTDHVLETSIAQGGAWRRAGLDLSVAVNLSARTLGDEALPQRVRALCARHGLPPERLVLEVTESMVLQDPVTATQTLGALAALDVVVSIDDFGTGFSSLEHLRRLPVSEVKIDRSFVLGLDGGERDRAIVRGTVQLAHALGLRVVAEGVEHLEAATELAALGCETGQGFLWDAALPAAEVPAAVVRIAALSGRRVAA